MNNFRKEVSRLKFGQKNSVCDFHYFIVFFET